jgi:hypothetical protein
VNLTYINFTYTIGGVPFTQTFCYFNFVDSPTVIPSPFPAVLMPGNVNLVFRQEEIKLGRKPTIRRVIVKASGFGILNISVSGKSFGNIILDGTTNVKTYKTTQGIYTGEDPQLTISSIEFQGQIIKVMMAGTYADGDID